jgi:glycosyltransferase involved in cell wall biosynthesis
MVIDTVTRGGAERVLISLANGLDRERFRVHVITTRDRGDFADELAPHVSVHSLHRTTRWDLAAMRRFAKLTNHLGVQLVHTHSHSAAYFVRLAGALHGRRWRHVMHDHHGPVEGSFALRLADRLLLRHVDYYFAVSDRLARYATESLGVPATRAERLANGVDVGQAPNAERTGEFTIVHLARVAPEKGHDLAIRIATHLAMHLPSFRWLCIGSAEGPYSEVIRDQVRRSGLASQFTFLGERADIPALLRHAHAGVLTSRWEGLPMALLEYMAAALPVVVTDVGDCARVVREAGGGSVLPIDDVDGFAAALLDLAQHPEVAARAGLRNYEHVRVHYGSEAMVLRVSEVYDRLLAGASTGGGTLSA